MKKPVDFPSLKQSLRDRRPTIGSWLSFAYPPLVEIMGRAGFEWLAIDMEHTATGHADMMGLIAAIDGAGSQPLVRVGANDPLLIKRALDCGAHGVIIPDVRSVDAAQAAISAAYFPPLGNRGFGLFRAQDYGAGFQSYRDWVADSLVVIVQIESVEAVDCLEDILDVDGVDAFMIGPYDLSGSLGAPGQFNTPEFTACLKRIERVMSEKRKAGGVHIVHPNEDSLMKTIDDGYTFITYGVDQVFFGDAVAEASAHLAKLHSKKA